jgi:hypothetical protein
MNHPTDLPAALPIAIAMALLVLVLAPWLDDTEAEPCTTTAVAAVGSVTERPADGDCD